jgi:serine/threonine-protein kinase
MTDVPDRLKRALADRYRIERELGAGGMATVYLAEDLKHDRKVAIKVLRPELAAVVGAERFLAEIKTTANLQHPNILPLFDSGEADSFLFYVMPFVEGESLRDRLDREKQLRVEDAIALTRKVADALDYAHGKGVVHRDIKPANILLSERGEPLVADFGIALAVSQAGDGRITETGLSLGTPHYMSPEQATGDRDVDPRSDIYALGCVLYELLAGQPPFAAPTAQAVLARILTEQPRRVTELRRTVPPHVASVLDQALEKLPADRFESAQAFLDALDDPEFSYETQLVTAPFLPARRVESPSGTRSRSAVVPALAAGLVVALAAAAAGWLRSPPTPTPVPTTRTALADFPVEAPSGSGERFAISRDGSRVAVISHDEGSRQLYWRNSDEVGRTRIETGTFPGSPQFSPDGAWLAFADDDGLHRAELATGQVFPVHNDRGGAHWGTDEMMVFTDAGGLFAISPTGGEATSLLEAGSPLNPGGLSRPFLLPDGSGVLLEAGVADQATGDRTLYVYEMGTGEVVDLGVMGSNPKYVSTGHLVFGRQSQAVVAVEFDLRTLRVTSQPTTVLTGVTVYGGGAMQFAVSDNGTAFYESGGTGGGSLEALVVIDFEGARTETAIGTGNFAEVRWSPDGASIAYASIADGARNIHRYNVDLRTAPRQVTLDGNAGDPVWSPDGTRLAYSTGSSTGSAAEITDALDLFVRDLTTTDPPVRVVTLPGNQFPEDWPSADVLLFESFNDGDLDEGFRLVDPTAPDGPTSIFLDSNFSIDNPRVSPSGDLVAYVSNESGQDEVYLRSFPVPSQSQPERISFGGGLRPAWSPDGRTVYYWSDASDWTLIAARIDPGPPFALLARDTVGTFPDVGFSHDIHPDGDRMIAVVDAGGDEVEEDDAEPARAILVTNWFAELERLTGGGR